MTASEGPLGFPALLIAHMRVSSGTEMKGPACLFGSLKLGKNRLGKKYVSVGGPNRALILYQGQHYSSVPKPSELFM